MQNLDKKNISVFDVKAVLEIISREIYPRSIKEIRKKLKHTGRNLPEYLISRALRGLLSEGKVRYKAGRWMSNEVYEQIKVPQTGFTSVNVALPSLSKFSEPILNERDNETGTKSHPKIEKKGPWDRFRKLLSYYSECLRNEEGAEAIANIDEIWKRYLYVSGIGNWYPKTGSSWNYIIPLGSHVSDFVQNLSRTNDNIIMLGYPIEVFHYRRENEPDTKLIRPIFLYMLDCSFSNNSITLNTEDAQPEISLEWLKYKFNSYSEQYHFLSSCGLINQPRPLDEPIGFSSDDKRSDLNELSKTLSAFLSRQIKEPLNCNSIISDPIQNDFKPGIYNKAVIIIGNRTKYTQTLLSELNKICSQPDNILDQTSLKYIFKDEINSLDLTQNDRLHEETVADVLPLNVEQREAVGSLLKEKIVIVTGPPGTGKSQMVMGCIANSRFNEKPLLFASRNHKAIDAVVNRLFDRENRPLILRTNSKDDPNLIYTFRNAIKDVQIAYSDVEHQKQYEEQSKRLNELLSKRGEYALSLNQIYEISDNIGQLEEELSSIKEQISDDIYDNISTTYNKIDQKQVIIFRKLINILKNVLSNSFRIQSILYMTRYLWILPLWISTYKWMLGITDKLLNTKLPPITIKKIRSLDLEKIDLITKCIALFKSIAPLELKLKSMPQRGELVVKIKECTKGIKIISEELIFLDIQRRIGLLPNSEDHKKIYELDLALNTRYQRYTDEKQQIEIEKILVDNTPTLLKYFPCWAVTNLSVGSRIPLAPGVFDLAIVDEASQCDIASAVPILYRAKRAGVVGDPNQLKHVSKLSPGKDALLRKRSDLHEISDIKFSYREKSLFDLFAQSESVIKHLLRETYRSCVEIAEYSNRTFYNGILRVATNVNDLNSPRDTKIGVHWTNAVGPVVSAGRSGCVSEVEVDVIYGIVKKILVDNQFRGSIGVVTPFRQQQKRLHDRIFDSDIPYEKLNQASINVDTSHGFQGDEKDVMIFSLCSGPDMPQGSLYFVRDNANLFNVAVSRARAVLHVVGNREWAFNCGIKHIEQLARFPIERTVEQITGPWAPHESPWEKLFYAALTEKGLNPVPQYQIAGRRLDLALIDEKNDLKIDIEVDSDRWHRNPDGTRKKDDTWRDIYLMSLGWRVLRFWVYNLKDDMQKCVSTVENVWRGNE